MPSSTVQATLTGSTPIGTNYADFTYTCDGDGCTLSPNTIYYLVASAPGSSQYSWEYTTPINNYTAVPSGNGWDIGTGWSSSDGWATWKSYGYVGKFKVTAISNP